MGIAVKDAVLAAFLVVDHELDGDIGLVRPLRIGRISPIADKIARIGVAHGRFPASADARRTGTDWRGRTEVRGNPKALADARPSTSILTGTPCAGARHRWLQGKPGKTDPGITCAPSLAVPVIPG